MSHLTFIHAADLHLDTPFEGLGRLAPEIAEVLRALEEKGKADFTLELELKDLNGIVVAQVRGTWQARRIPEGFPVPWPTDAK